MNFTLIRSMLYNLIKTYGGVEAIWTDQSEPRVTPPYASMKIISGPQRVGTDDELRADGSVFTSTGQRKFTLSVQFFGAGALENASNLLDGLETYSARTLMQTKNVGMTGAGSVQNLTALLDNRFEQRAAIDLFFTASSEIIDDVGYIANAEIENLDD